MDIISSRTHCQSSPAFDDQTLIDFEQGFKNHFIRSDGACVVGLKRNGSLGLMACTPSFYDLVRPKLTETAQPTFA